MESIITFIVKFIAVLAVGILLGILIEVYFATSVFAAQPAKTSAAPSATTAPPMKLAKKKVDRDREARELKAKKAKK